MAYLGREAAKAPLVTADIPDDSITSAKIVDATIAAGDLAANSVDSSELVDGSIDTSHIADNQVTLAKMAGGTDGNIISYDASGDPVAIATGDDGEVLTSTGAGSPPAFEAAGGNAGTGYFAATCSGSGFSALSAGTLCAFNSVSETNTVDDDSNYTTGTSRYTAPATGIYQFAYVIYTSDSDLSNSFEFRINGARLDFVQSSDQYWNYMNMDSQGDYTLNSSVILKLTSSQYVSVHAHDLSDFNHDKSFWWGCRLK